MESIKWVPMLEKEPNPKTTLCSSNLIKKFNKNQKKNQPNKTNSQLRK
jgi:hypothetical protein